MRFGTASVASALLAVAVSGCAQNVLLRPLPDEAHCPTLDSDGRLPAEPKERRDDCTKTFVEIGCPPVDDHGLVRKDLGKEPAARWDSCRSLPARWRYTLTILELDDQGRFRKDGQLG